MRNLGTGLARSLGRRGWALLVLLLELEAASPHVCVIPVRPAYAWRNLVAFQRRIRREDLSLTHTIIHPTIDKSTDAQILVDSIGQGAICRDGDERVQRRVERLDLREAFFRQLL